MSTQVLRLPVLGTALGTTLLLTLGVGVSWHNAAASPEPAKAGAGPAPLPLEQEYSPVVRDTTATNLYWGDTHLHTRNSGDAFSLGDEELSAEDAFRFARGEQVLSNTGQKVKLRRPLDFLAVSDHAEFLGAHVLIKGNSPLLGQWATGRRWAELLRAGDGRQMMLEYADANINPKPGTVMPESVMRSVWSEVATTADRFNAPGRFTAFIAYEWTSMPNSGDNLHRVVLFRDGADKAVKTLPFSAQDSIDPERLWAVLDTYERESGGRALAIPHNSNLSNGLMFAPRTLSGQAFTAAYARTRMRWEPVVEVTQIKGDSEAHPSLSPTDEFADFERWDEYNVAMTARKEPWMLRYEYLRSALRDGLQHQARIGVNPFKVGMIGSTDSHTALSTTAEDNFFGKYGDSEPTPDRTERRTARHYNEIRELGASGLAAVWAPENTREAIFSAFERREVYGTTGSRIRLRFFGGFDFEAPDVRRPDYAQIGYRKGVPMGGELLKAPAGKAPRFMVVAAKDPDDANLDRVQIIKGWLDAKGETHERIYDVALSDGRRVDPKTGKAPPVGSTVDVANATWTNSIGDPELATVWTDPEFDASQAAFYYVRVLEIPKPRWTAYDQSFYHKPMAAKIPTTVQDRAYSSPIWYQP